MGLKRGEIGATPLSEFVSNRKTLDLDLLELAGILAKRSMEKCKSTRTTNVSPGRPDKFFCRKEPIAKSESGHNLMQKLGIPVPSKFRIIEDTTEFMEIDKDDVLLLGNRPYLILRSA